jgi:hypothetical protein
VFNRSAIQPNSTVSPCSPPSPRPLSPALPIRLSDGEVHFLWSFIQGSIMIPETRRALRRAWGMCQRHSYGFLAVDAAFRHGWLHAPTILYADLMERARAALDIGGLFWPARLAARLRARGSCLMCDLGYGPHSVGTLRPELLAQGQNPTEIARFVYVTAPFWRWAVCGRCEGSGTPNRCRPHLCEELAAGAAVDLDAQRTLVGEIHQHIQRYHRAFRWEDRGTDTVEDRAALISAVGWCSGWQVWLDDSLRR